MPIIVYFEVWFQEHKWQGKHVVRSVFTLYPGGRNVFSKLPYEEHNMSHFYTRGSYGFALEGGGKHLYYGAVHSAKDTTPSPSRNHCQRAARGHTANSFLSLGKKLLT